MYPQFSKCEKIISRRTPFIGVELLDDYKGGKTVYTARVKETTFRCDVPPPPKKKRERPKERKKKEKERKEKWLFPYAAKFCLLYQYQSMVYLCYPFTTP